MTDLGWSFSEPWRWEDPDGVPLYAEPEDILKKVEDIFMNK